VTRSQAQVLRELRWPAVLLGTTAALLWLARLLDVTGQRWKFR
jgi:hypothetical protein